jgi:hypothetical protein
VQVQDGGAGWSCRVEVRVGVRVESDYREDYAHADLRACLQPFSYVCSLGGSTQPGSLLRRPAPPAPPLQFPSTGAPWEPRAQYMYPHPS